MMFKSKPGCRRFTLPVPLRVSVLVALAIVASTQARAREYYFSPSSLEGGALAQPDIDLSLFSKSNAQLPGRYPSRIKLNETRLDDVTLTYFNGPDGQLQPQVTPLMLRQWGVKVDNFPTLAALPASEPIPELIGHYIPLASATLEFSTLTLKVSIPQAAINDVSRGYIDPALWDDGVPVMFTDYAFSGIQSSNKSNNTSSQYLNLRSGINAGGWRVRNYSTWSQTSEKNSWENISTFIQHDLDLLRAQFTAGENSTRGDVFDSLQYRGVNIASDEQMLPYSQRGFAPTIRGIASSNAEVSVRQNGYLIYQKNVAPGAFEITDLYSTTNSGDLEVTVKEADGTEHRFIQPYSSVAVMQRQGHMKYEVTAARYRANGDGSHNEPLFAQGSLIYGVNNILTLFGGVTASEKYHAGNTGAGISLGPLGSLSADVTFSKARLDNDASSSGSSYRLLYSGKIDTTDTNFTLASYRYSTQGYYSFEDANQKYDAQDVDWSFRYNKRNRIQASISQSLWGSSFYLNGYQQDYWGTSERERSLSAGFNTVISGVNLHLAWTYSRAGDESKDSRVSFGLSVPLSRWLPRAWSSYNLSNSKSGGTSQSLGINGTLLEDERMSYALQQSRTGDEGVNSSSLYGTYRSRYANLNAGYFTSSENNSQLSYGASGAIVAHPHGVTLSQPLGSQFAVINTNGASGVRFLNQRGIQTDWLGNAVIPSLTPYQENTIRVDTTTLPPDVDTTDTAVTVIPTRNAAVRATFDAKVGYRIMATLTRPRGGIVPFGAVATSEDQTLSGIVDDTGTLYLAGLRGDTRLSVQWGDKPDQRCVAMLSLDELKQPANKAGIRLLTVPCQPETVREP